MCITNPLKISDFQGNLLHMLLFPQKHAFYFSILRIKEGLLHVQQPQKADLLFFHPTKECLQFLYVTVIEVLQSVKNVDTVGFIPGTGKEFLRGYAEVFTDAQKFVH